MDKLPNDIPELCLFNVGDEIFYQGKLCEIIEVRHDGVMIELSNRKHIYIFCDKLQTRKMRLAIEYTKREMIGRSHPHDDKELLREKTLLEDMGWKVKVLREEVPNAPNNI